MFFKNIFGGKPEQNTIFIGLIGGVGDLVLAAPSVAMLKKNNPSASICFGVGAPPFHSTIKNDPHIDRFETPFFYNVWKEKERNSLLRKKQREFERAILLDNPDRDWWKKGRHLIDIYAEKCGVTLEHRRPLVYVSPEDESIAEKILLQNGVAKDDKLVVLSPEVRSKKEVKEWPYSNFVQLIERIHGHSRVKIITFVSPSEQRDYPGTVTIKDPHIGAAAVIIRRANLFVGLDNGLTHIAGAFEGKIVSIHIGFPSACCGVLSPNAVLVEHEPFCSPDSISVDEVYSKVKDLI